MGARAFDVFMYVSVCVCVRASLCACARERERVCVSVSVCLCACNEDADVLRFLANNPTVMEDSGVASFWAKGSRSGPASLPATDLSDTTPKLTASHVNKVTQNFFNSSRTFGQ